MSPSAQPTSTRILAVDTGGTFTDLLLSTADGVRRLKLASTPGDPARAVLEGMARITGDADPELVLHGSTVGTNALLERKGARVVLVTNRGFEDVIEIGRQNRPQLYALVGHRPPPLVSREDRLGIAGRLGPSGDELLPLDGEELAALAGRIARRHAGAVAVVLLHAYADGAHEERVGEALDALDVPVTLSSTLLPEHREYERGSTAVVNAYIAPVMSTYLRRLDRETGRVPVRIMGSDGGALPVERAGRQPVHTILSGPAGGVVGARVWAERAGFSDVVTLDMGGTSTDVSICPGRLLHTREFQIAGHPVAVPVLDIHTVGAGGGSIARVDPGGALRVGPESAGADPGPVCYGRGGDRVTVTDAHVWLGRLPPDAFLGGEMRLDRKAVETPMAELARALGVTLEEAAEGVVTVADAAMERALRVISVERGYDPSGFALVAFGGAGGLHAAELAHRLGADRAIVPPGPGLLSAWGMLAAPVSREASRTLLTDTRDPRSGQRMDEAFGELQRRAVEGLMAEGVSRERITTRRTVDARYRGQSFELRVTAEGWIDAFHRAHEERYGYARRESVLEAVTLRVSARASAPDMEPPQIAPGGGDPPGVPVPVHLGGGERSAMRFARDDLGAGDRVRGPAVIAEYSATTWVPAGWSASVDDRGCLHLIPAT